MATVELFETQLSFLDRVVASGEHGDSREDAMRSVLLAHVAQRLGGVTDHVGGKAEPDVIETEMPDYGASRLEVVLEPVTGKAVEVRRGEVLRIEQLVGGTCVDFNAFNLHDHKEFLDCGFTRSFQSFDPRKGEFIWTNSPRGRPMFGILEIADTCELDIVGHRCNRVFQELGWEEPAHPNCQDSLAEAIREYGLTPDDVHDSFNLWMATTIDPRGQAHVQLESRPQGRHDRPARDVRRPGRVAASAGSATWSASTTTASSRSRSRSSRAPTPTNELVDRDRGPLGKDGVTGHEEDMASTPVLSSRALKRDPDYAPRYLPVPETVKLEVELGPEETTVVDGLVRTGVYGADEGEALRAAFMRWCNLNLTLVRRPMVSFGPEPATS